MGTILNWIQNIMMKKKDIYKKIFSNIKNIDMDYGLKECHYTFADITVSIYIEIKPLMGDDYPNVLRKMTTQQKLTDDKDGKYILLIHEYASQYTTKEQIIQIFKQSKIRIIFTCELFDSLPSQTNKLVEEICEIKTFQPTKELEEEENKLLREKLLQAEEKIKQLEEEIQSLKLKNKVNLLRIILGRNNCWHILSI